MIAWQLAAFVLLAATLCLRAAPGDAFLDPLQFTPLGVFNPATNVLVDLKSGLMSGGGSFAGLKSTQAGANLLVFTFSSFYLGSGVSITFTNDGAGSPAVVFLSQGDMTIAGSIIGDGHAGAWKHISLGDGEETGIAAPGNGGPAGGNPNMGPGTGGIGDGCCGGGGGGGGGYGGPGGNGGANAGNLGGTGYNADLSSLLMGGSGGGDGYGGQGGGGLAGGGGGALQLGALASLTISGTVSANGAEGGAGANFSCCYPAGGGGGASGGGILLQADQITINPGAVVSVIGGTGGNSPGLPTYSGGGGGGGGGRVYIGYHDSVVTNGSFNLTGGAGGGAPFCPPGTNGASGTLVATQSSRVPAGLILGATLASGNRVLLSWPVSATNYLPEATGSLAPGGAWSPFTNGAAIIGNTCVVTNPTGAAPVFFRLHSRP